MSTVLRIPLPTRRDTRRLASALASVVHVGNLVILEGDLGAGKTFFTRAFARALGTPQQVPVTSPTFTLLQSLSARIPILHGDLYRLGDESELEELGLRESSLENVVVLEWAERFLAALGGDALVIRFEVDQAGSRTAALQGYGVRGTALFAAISGRLPSHA